LTKQNEGNYVIRRMLSNERFNMHDRSKLVRETL